MTAPQVVVVGCPSLDRVVVDGRPRAVLGGAAFVTALAARVAGATVGLLARVPTRLPDGVARVFGPGGLDRGGLVVGDEVLPSFHIVYDRAHRATYVTAEPGTEHRVAADDLPEAWLVARLIHVAALAGSTGAQLRFVAALRARGYRGLLSAGTWPEAVAREPEQVGELLTATDLFFLNEGEAAQLIPEGAPPLHRGVICVTRGASGVTLLGGRTTRFAAPAVDEVVDPTGAGDSFCGGFLGATVRGLEPVPAALAIAAHSLSGWGAEALAERVAADVGPRVELDAGRIAVLAPSLGAEASESAISFAGFPFPEPGDPDAAEILAAATLHQYGFWDADPEGWQGPMYAVAGGRRWKGSDFVWQAFTRAGAARLDEDIATLCADDQGICPLPDLASHRELHAAYRAALERSAPGGWPVLLERLAESTTPVADLLSFLADLPGYREDPLAKKATLLALILLARPEGLLRGDDRHVLGPVVDYHLMRGCLRTGVVRVVDADLRARLVARRWVDGVEEAELRGACHEALQRLQAAAGLSVAAVDGFFFTNGRAVCLETEPARCEACPIAAGCGRHAELFQPVFRTTSY